MRRLNEMTHEEVIAYNLRDGGTAVTIFADAQTGRVMRARGLIRNILAEDPGPKFIYEPGCSAGDISGFFSEDHRVAACDVTPDAVRLTRERWPKVEVVEAEVEDVEPVECDILVLCEFMEHVIDPVGLAEAWLPKARHVIIGHPLVGDNWDAEPGHVWAYYEPDFRNWFEIGGHELVEEQHFPMYDLHMVIGRGRRRASQ